MADESKVSIMDTLRLPGLILRIREKLMSLTSEQRLEVLNKIMDGYCKRCGTQVASSHGCPCTNDE